MASICLPDIDFQLYFLMKWSEKAFLCVYDHYTLSKVKSGAHSKIPRWCQRWLPKNCINSVFNLFNVKLTDMS